MPHTTTDDWCDGSAAARCAAHTSGSAVWLPASTASDPGGPPSLRWTARPWLSPPRDLSRLATLAAVTHTAVAKQAWGPAASVLLEAAPGLGRLSHVGGLADAIGTSDAGAPILRALAVLTGRPSTVLRALSQTTLPLRIGTQQAQIPTIAHVEHLPDRWQQLNPPAQLLQRAVLSIAVARLAGMDTWAEAGVSLGYAEETAARWVRYVLRKIGEGAKHDLADSAQTALDAIANQRIAAPRPHKAISSFVELKAWAQAIDC